MTDHINTNYNQAGECHLCGTHSNDDDDHDGGDNKAHGDKKAIVLNNRDDSQCSLNDNPLKLLTSQVSTSNHSRPLSPWP